MSNFTKSLVYSTTVLAVGVVGIIAIYNSNTPSSDANRAANISPAAGVSSPISSEIKDAASAVKTSAESVKLTIYGATDSIAPVIEEEVKDAVTIIEKTLDTNEISPAKDAMKNFEKGSSGPHFIPGKSGFLQTSKYVILVGSRNAPTPNQGGMNIGDIGDILDQATKDAKNSAKKSSRRKNKGYSDYDKKRLLKALSDSKFAEKRKGSPKSNKPQMSQQAFLLQQALKASKSQENGGNAKLFDKDSLSKKLMKTVSLDAGSTSNKSFGVNANTLSDINFTNLSNQSAASAQAAADAAVANAATYASAQSAALTAYNNAKAISDASAAIAATAANNLAAAQANLTAAQAAVVTAQTGLATAGVNLADAQTALAADPLNPILIAAEASAQSTNASAQTTLSNAQAAESAATPAVASAQTASTAANAQAATDLSVTNTRQAILDQATIDANAAATVATDTQTAATSAASSTGNGAALGTATTSAAGISAGAQSATANRPQQTTGTLYDQAALNAKAAVTSATANLSSTAVSAASTVAATAQTNLTSAIAAISTSSDPTAALANAKNSAKGTISGIKSAVGNIGGLTNLTSGISGGLAGALGGDLDVSTITTLVAQVAMSLPSKLISTFPSVPFVGQAISGIIQSATKILSGASAPLDFFGNVISEVTDYQAAASNVASNLGSFADPTLDAAVTNLQNAGGSVSGLGSIVNGASASAVTDVIASQ